ncbi:MAG TPA: aminopeptidase, partial [Flavobacterium sp.]|nr:aminopeptidase [Flavobacterium sp.]
MHRPLFIAIVLFSVLAGAQHRVTIRAQYDAECHTFDVDQQVVFKNQSADTLRQLIFNDWNNAYSAKKTPLAERFSDEFKRAFYYAKDVERGYTQVVHILCGVRPLEWRRPDGHPDLVSVLTDAIRPGDSAVLLFRYQIKLPHKRFTGFGYDDDGFVARDAFLMPALYRDGFVLYSNEDLDDAALALADYDIRISVPHGWRVESELDVTKYGDSFELRRKNAPGFTVYGTPGHEFHSFKNQHTEVLNNLRDNRLDDISKALVVDRVVNFTQQMFGPAPKKVVVSQTDYQRNPFYGLNQLPRFLNTFSDVFVYELKFLKTYLSAYLKQVIAVDPRAETWINDGLETYAMMRYMDEIHPGALMTGSLGNVGILKSYNITTTDFNSQY